MKKILSTLVIGIMLLLTSCGSHETPDSVTPDYRLAFLYSDDDKQIYTYDKNGLIGEWSWIDSKNDSNLCTSTYQYAEDGRSIMITSEEDRGTNQWWIFEETLYLNQNGTAKTAIGTARISTEKENAPYMKKNYVAEFRYDDSGYLTRIDFTEKRIDDDIQTAMEWNVQLKWDNGNLIECSEAYASGRQIVTYTFSYLEGLSVEFPIPLPAPILHFYYTPLMYQGVLGPQSCELVKSKRRQNYNWNSSIESDYTATFSYTLSSSSTSTRVEEFVKLEGKKGTKYIVGWENK